jgi:hypothetical protein
MVETDEELKESDDCYVVNDETYVKGGHVKFNGYYHTIMSNIDITKTFKGVHKLFFTISESKFVSF